MTGTVKKMRNAVIALIGILVILTSVIVFVDHSEAMEHKAKSVTLKTLAEVDEQITDDTVVQIDYRYDPETGKWTEIIEHDDGTYDGFVY